VSDDEVIRRITNRRTCTECGTGYNLIYVQPDEEGVCDRCGGDLVQREDSKPDVVKKRLRIYHDTTKPLIDYYSDRDLLVHINGEQPIQKVYDDITDRITA
jgi:adenylate kinase